MIKIDKEKLRNNIELNETEKELRLCKSGRDCMSFHFSC